MRYALEQIRLISVYCRTKWDDGKPAGKGKSLEETDEDGYLNLGKLVGASSSRGMTSFTALMSDTSTYHYNNWSPWRGKRGRWH